MNKSAVVAFLKQNQDPRGIENWKGQHDGPLKSYGIGLTVLRKFAKSIGRDAKLARLLWNSDVYEMKIISILIDDPKSMTVQQAETQVDDLEGGYLAHVFSSCDAPLAKTPFVIELADKWIKSKDPMRRRCGYGLLYEISKKQNKSAPDDSYFLKHIAEIERTWKRAATPIQMAMACALMGIGKRTKQLNAAALKVAQAIGPINHSDTCDPFDAAKHLTGDHTRQKLGL